jgi:hypothetical protein
MNMPDTDSSSNSWKMEQFIQNCLLEKFAGKSLRWLKLISFLTLSVSLGFSLSSCRQEAIASPRTIVLEQSWELDLGDQVEGFSVVGGLGDVSVHLRGAAVRAPFDGEVEIAAKGERCFFFSSSEIPAYLFRYCGLQNARLGIVQQGQRIGKANYLHFATMRRQPEGTWAIVEPSTSVLERSLELF